MVVNVLFIIALIGFVGTPVGAMIKMWLDIGLLKEGRKEDKNLMNKLLTELIDRVKRSEEDIEGIEADRLGLQSQMASLREVAARTNEGVEWLKAAKKKEINGGTT